MATIEFRVASGPHHRRRRRVPGLHHAACVVACPANLFVPTADGGILFNYEQCFECGTCYLVCNAEGAITWTYPDGGHGVVVRGGSGGGKRGAGARDHNRGPDARTAGASPPTRRRWSGLCAPGRRPAGVLAVSAGPSAAEAVLRQALAAGATRAASCR